MAGANALLCDGAPPLNANPHRLCNYILILFSERDFGAGFGKKGAVGLLCQRT